MPVNHTQIRNWVIYKLTNPSGSVYVGKSCRFKARMLNYKNKSGGCNQQPILYNSLVKYGFDSHKLEIIEEFKSNVSYADGKEMFWIRTYMSNINAWRNNGGMNLTNGGGGAPGNVWSQESRDKLSKSHKGKKISPEQRAYMSQYFTANPSKAFLGKKHTDETKRKMSKDRTGKPNYKLRGYKHSDETRLKSSIAHKGIPNKNKGKSIWSPEDKKRIGESKIGNTYTKGMKWSDEAKQNMRLSKKDKSKPIIQFHINGDYICEYMSVRDAARNSGMSRTAIKEILGGITKTPKTFTFKYK